MAWPDRRICNGCKKVFNSDECEIDIGDFWNCREEMVYLLIALRIQEKLKNLTFIILCYHKVTSPSFILCCYITKENNEEFKRLSSGFK